MDISNAQFLHGAQTLQGPHRMAGARSEASTGENTAGVRHSRAIQDDVRFSSDLMKINSADQSETSSSGVRFELVNRIKAEIANGTYETPDKMDIALSRMLAR